MEGVPFDWNDYLSSEGLSDIAPTGFGMQGVQTGQDGSRMHDWHDQQLASQQKSYSGLNTAGRTFLDHEEDLVSFAHDYETIVSQDLYRNHCSTRNLETSEAPTPLEQAPGCITSPIETGPDTFTQEVHDLGVLLPDQNCTCAVCLDRSSELRSRHTGSKLHRTWIEWRHEHPESRLWTFGCRVTGCQWTKKGDLFDRVFDVWYHETSSSHYGKPGDYKCLEANCKFITKRFRDLKRHYSSKHCIKPRTLKCPVLSCRYHQDGFARKDKLDSHYQKVHGGKSQPGKPNQAIKPKVGDNA